MYIEIKNWRTILCQMLILLHKTLYTCSPVFQHVTIIFPYNTLIVLATEDNKAVIIYKVPYIIYALPISPLYWPVLCNSEEQTGRHSQSHTILYTIYKRFKPELSTEINPKTMAKFSGLFPNYGYDVLNCEKAEFQLVDNGMCSMGLEK